MFRRQLLSIVILAGMLFSQSIPLAMAATCNSAQFVSDLTIPDGSAFAPGTGFTKTWRLLNNGTCTWSTSYSLVWVGGDRLGAPLVVRLPVSVPPGQMLDLSVSLTAPAAAGHFQALFKLANSSGGQFGIGSSSNDAFWADINVVDVSAVIYDFVANAAYAQWKSGAGGLPFPGASGDYRGYSSAVNSPHLEDDSYDSSPGLLTVPQNKFNGYIQATYPEFQIQAGDRLQTLVNCEFGAASCYVTFRIDYVLPNGVQRTLWTWKEAYDKRFYRANLDLSALAGQKVRFVFMLLSSGLAGGDRALWGSPRIVRSGGGQPPSPPATLTPLPPLTPTATPFLPPPTIQAAGCDRAAFVTDVTVQDGAIFAPGAAFTKTWRLKNVGSCVWTTAYKLVYHSGEQMSAPTTVNLPWGAAYGQTVDISVNMIAPPGAGKYRGYWILANANGQLFGIGTDASKPVWVEINVAGDSPAEATYYDFVTNVCSAEWKNTAGVLPCPGTDGDGRGFVLPQNPVKLEDGSTGTPGILTFPQNRYNGYIQGYYPTFTVQPGDRFQTTTSCDFGVSCYVTFRLDFMFANGAMTNFWQSREQNDGKVGIADVDLTPLAGRSGRFVLTILATGSATNDRALWSSPRIVRASTTPPTITPSPTFTPPPVVSSPQINKLFMMDAMNGWAIGNSYVLRTSNGGLTWYNFSMPGISAVTGAFFQNTSKGWVLATLAETGTTALFRTINGGSSWTAYGNMPFPGGYVQFLNDTNGFVLTVQPIGMQKFPVMLYQTSDGGATWVLKFAHAPNLPTNGLPLSGSKNGMVFLDTARGWIGGESPLSGSIYLYRTENGGTTWSQQALSVPAGYELAYIVTTAPTFFGANEGVLPVWISADVGQRILYLYITHDGGTTWERSPAFAQHSSQADIVSMRDILSWDTANNFDVTNSSGGSWRQVSSNVDFGEGIRDLDFVSTTTGWVLDSDLDGNKALYRTTDGGVTWTTLFNNMPAEPLPDLTITGMQIELQNPSCLTPGDPTGVRIAVQNNGQTAAGSFVVRVNNLDQTVNGLGVGEATTLFFPTTTNPVTAIIDATGAVVESNENNNVRSEMVPVPTPPAPCVTAADFAQTVVNNLNAKNFDAVKNGMGQSFGMGYWQSQGNSYSPEDAIQQLQLNYISASTMLVPDPSKDWNALAAGFNPYTIMGLDPAQSQALFVSGWGLDGQGEAILYVTRRPDGTYYFDSVLIAPTGFAPTATPVTLTGPYAVVGVASTDVLNIRAGAGVDQPVVGSFAPYAVDVMRTGATAVADNATWVEVQNPSGGTGWVNSYYLTEYVTRDAFCADPKIAALLEQLKGSMNQSNGNMLAGMVSPLHGVNVQLWKSAPPNNFTTATAGVIFTSTDVLNWGTGGGQGGPEPVTGTFAQVIQPKLQEVLNAPNLETYCDALTQLPGYPNMWPYGNIHYYNLYKPGTSGIDLDFRSWLVGFEYINGQPYLYSMVTIVWEP